jgi:hypothetical protein
MGGNYRYFRLHFMMEVSNLIGILLDFEKKNLSAK